MVKAVLFDMDGVIVDTEPLHKKAYYLMFDHYNLEVSEATFQSFTGQSTIYVCKQLCDLFDLKVAPEALMRKKRVYFKDLFFNDPDLKLIEGVLDIILDYHKNGLILVLASSASMVTINNVFKRFDLDPYFKAKISGADLKASKPHPEIFEKAAKLAGFKQKECIVIEDSTNGIEAAKAAGSFCIGFDSFHSKNQDYTKANLVVSDFKDIPFTKIINLV